MTLDVGEAFNSGTTNHRHHHDHYLDITLDVGEVLNSGRTNHHHDHHDQGYFYQGGQVGICPPLNFDNPKRSKIWYVACGTIIHRIAG